jgi:hypothetical protein
VPLESDAQEVPDVMLMAKRVAMDANGNPFLDQFRASGCVYGVFRIAAIKSSAKSHSLRLAASHRGVDIGFRAIVRRRIRGVFGGDLRLIPAHIYQPAVEFIRTGAESDTMIAALRELFGMPEKPVRMADITPFAGIALHLDEGDLETQAIKIKLLARDFDGDIDRDVYHESFLTLDLPARLALWHEKDSHYRAPLIRAISTG